MVFIASADFMNRNLSKRVELLIPIEDGAARRRLISILEIFFTDNVQARVLGNDGIYRPVAKETGKAIRAQEVFARDAAKRAKQHVQTPDTLVPHLPKVEG